MNFSDSLRNDSFFPVDNDFSSSSNSPEHSSGSVSPMMSWDDEPLMPMLVLERRDSDFFLAKRPTDITSQLQQELVVDGNPLRAPLPITFGPPQATEAVPEQDDVQEEEEKGVMIAVPPPVSTRPTRVKKVAPKRRRAAMTRTSNNNATKTSSTTTTKKRRTMDAKSRDLRRAMMHKQTDKERRERIKKGIAMLEQACIRNKLVQQGDQATIVQACANHILNLEHENKALKARLAAMGDSSVL